MELTSRKIYVGVTVISALILGGAVVAQKNEDAAAAALMSKNRVAPEIVLTKGLLPANGQRTVTAGYVAGKPYLQVRNVATDWAYAETDDWILLNGFRGTALCPSLLGDFAAANAPREAMSLARIWLLASGFEGAPLRLNLHIPRFATAPANLDKCTGFSYDQATGQLRVGRKFVAYLSSSQAQVGAVTQPETTPKSSH